MRFPQVCAAALLCLPLGVGHAADAYLCVSRLVTGFSYDKTRHTWHGEEFRGERKYLVSRSAAAEAQWEVVQVGEVVPTAYCKEDFSAAGVLTCRGFDEFKMNRINGRFIHAYLVGYWTDAHDGLGQPAPSLFKEGENAPFMELGECSAR